MLVNDPSRLLRTAVASADSALVIGEAENMSVSSESIGLDEQALRSALEQLVTTDVGVTTPQLRWAVLSSEAEFGLAIGETRFVESLLGGSLSDAADQFRSYVAEWQDPPRYLLSLADLD
ncbi:MAG: hypothetical protein ACJ76I_01100 [Gaiellaceae bacterium]